MRPAIGSTRVLRDRKEQISRNARLRHQIRLDDSDPRRPFDSAEVFGRRTDLVVRHRLREIDHRRRVRLPRVRGEPQAFAKIIDLPDEVRDRQRCRRGVLRASMSIRQVARRAASSCGPEPHRTVRDDVGHRRMVARETSRRRSGRRECPRANRRRGCLRHAAASFARSHLHCGAAVASAALEAWPCRPASQGPGTRRPTTVLP